MTRPLFVLIICLFSSMAWAQEENCAELGTAPSDELIKLIQTMKNDVLGGTPLFCRPKNKQLNDTEMDEAVSDYIQNIIATEKIGKEAIDSNDAILRVMRYVVMKNIWHVSSQEARQQILLSTKCSTRALNKLPIDGPLPPVKEVSSTEKEKVDLKFVTIMEKTCGAETFNEVVPYLSKDLLAEGMFYLSEIHPHHLKVISDQVCNILENSPDGLLNTTADQDLYREKDPKLMKGFSLWLSEIYNPKVEEAKQEKKPENSKKKGFFASLFTDSDEDKSEKKELVVSEGTNKSPNANIDRLFQDRGRKKKMDEILSKDELEGLSAFTSNFYVEANTCLRDDYECNKKILKKVGFIREALNKIQKNQNDKMQVTYRGTRGLPVSVVNGLENAAKTNEGFVLDKGFMSTSGSKKIADAFGLGFGGSYLFVIVSKKCVGVSEKSKHFQEDEFLCPPGMKFKVMKAASSGSLKTYFLEEAE